MAVSSRSSFLSLSRNPSRTPVLRPSLLAVAVQAAVIGLASPGAWAQTQTQTQTHVQTADDEARLMAQAPTKALAQVRPDRKSTRLNSSHSQISYAVFCLKKKTTTYCY